MVYWRKVWYNFIVLLITYCNFSDNIENESQAGQVDSQSLSLESFFQVFR